MFEDLHWNDSLSLGLLNELVVARPGRSLAAGGQLPPRIQGRMEEPAELPPAAPRSACQRKPCGTPCRRCWAPTRASTTLKSFLVERASGNPFFVEEIVRSLVDSGVLEGSARQLPPGEAVLEHRGAADGAGGARRAHRRAAGRREAPAAGGGRHRPRRPLHALAGDLRADGGRAARPCSTICRRPNFSTRRSSFPTCNTPSSTRSPTTSPTAGCCSERRRDIHARVVDAMEKLYADRLGEHVERLAHHAVRGELQDKAVHYLRQAGGKAAARSALADARAWFEQALGVLEGIAGEPGHAGAGFEIRLELRPVLRQLGEGRQMLEHLREAEVIAERLKDDRRRGQVCAFMTTVQSTLDELDEALDSGTRALEIARRLGRLAASHRRHELSRAGALLSRRL